MKEEILNNIRMDDIMQKYGIKSRRGKARCPFHGIDKHPSAQIYEKNFHCFTCGKHLDVIGFVQEYFNLDFKEAMQKINVDFNLGLNNNTKIDYQKILEIQEKRKENERLFNKLQEKFCNLCDLKFRYLNNIRTIDEELTINNWDELTEIQSMYENKVELIDIELDFLIDEMYEFKRTRI